MMSRIRPSLVVASLPLLLAGCSSIEGVLSGDKVDYRSASAKTAPLEVPPDLTQLARDQRFQPQGGVVSASTYGQAASAPAGPAVQTVAPAAIGEMRIERDGNQRWLYVPLSAEQMWPQLQAFWQERGFTLALSSIEAGVMETDWAENRAKLPQDGVRKLLGTIFDALYSTGERDKFRTRVERSPRGGSEVTITHRGLEEVYTSREQDQTRWQPRAADAQLEAEFLSRLMVKLGKRDEEARTAVAAAGGPAAPRARIVEGQAGAVLQIDDGFDRAWRRVGAALDRSGFTVEDRDRAAGLYYVRYVDPAQAGKAEPGFFQRLFSSKDNPAGPVRYRIALRRDGEARTNLLVQDAQGTPENGAAGQRIVSLLIDDLK